MNLLLVTGFTTADWHRAEALFDWHRKLHNQVPCGHLLLAAAKDAHEELRTKLRIAAELAFESVQELQVTAPDEKTNPKWHLFTEVALYLGRSTRWPWLWLEPDCVPLKAFWHQSLELAYDNQPMRYLGPHLKSPSDKLTLGRVSIYPASAVNDLTAKRELLPLSSKSRLIQYGTFKEGDALATVRQDAVLFHSCKSDALISKLDAAKPATGSKLIGKEEDFKQVRSTRSSRKA